MSAKTVIWGVCADSAGIVVNHIDRTEKLAGGGLRVTRRMRLSHEPAAAYAGVHAAPMPLRWQHDEELGEIVALRRAHGNLYAVGETPLTPDELAALAGEDGLRWSTGTNNRIRDPLRIVEVSLTPQAATNGLPPVSWHRAGVSRGNLPVWVAAELERASSREHRSRGALLIHEFGSEIGLRTEGRGFDHRIGERPEIEIRPGGRIISVNGRPVR
jgi:hypothetical protein